MMTTENSIEKGKPLTGVKTFSGVDFELGLKAVEELSKIKPDGYTMAQFALKWILMEDAVSCTIPGGKTPNR